MFAVTFKIGLFTFGGGLAMLPQMEAEFVRRNKWLTAEEIADIFALSQTLPGVIAVNAAMFAGWRAGGLTAALTAAFGSVLPSFIMLLFVTAGYQAFIENPYIAGAMAGIRAAVTGILAASVLRLGAGVLKDIFGWALFAAALFLAVFTGVNIVWIILGAALAGVVKFYVTPRGCR